MTGGRTRLTPPVTRRPGPRTCVPSSWTPRIPPPTMAWANCVNASSAVTRRPRPPSSAPSSWTPGTPPVTTTWGVFIATISGAADAEAAFLRAVELDPGSASAHNNLGYLYHYHLE